MTEDRDFCEMVFRDKKSAYGIVFIRMPHLQRQKKAKRVSELFRYHAEGLPHAMATLTETTIRIRQLTLPPDDTDTEKP